MTLILSAGAAALAILLAIWLGYPVIIAGLALLWRDRRVSEQRTGGWPRVTVVLATRDSFAAVTARIENLVETDYPDELLEIVVARDATSVADWSKGSFGDERVRIVAGDEPGGKASTLNAGVRAAAGEIIVLADTAQRFDRRTIPELVNALADSRFGAVSGALELGGASRNSPVHLYWRMEKWLRNNEARVHSSVGVTGAVYAIRRSLWPTIPSGALLDDVFVPMMVVMRSHRVGFSYHARAFDTREFQSDAEAARKSRTLTGVLQLLSICPGILSSRNPIRVQFVFHKLARLVSPLLVLVVAAAGMVGFFSLALAYPRAMMAASIAFVSLCIAVRPLRLATASVLLWTLRMQRATTTALLNGARKNWSVWSAGK